jgi:hypothetical protein
MTYKRPPRGNYTKADLEPCPRCGFSMGSHDRDPIGEGLFRFTCPEPD